MWDMSSANLAWSLGAGGGLFRHMVQNKGIVWPHRITAKLGRPGFSPGLLQDIVIGAGAGIVMVKGASVPDLAILGGFAGAALLQRKISELLGPRLRYTVSEEVDRNSAETRDLLAQWGYTPDQIERAMQELEIEKEEES